MGVVIGVLMIGVGVSRDEPPRDSTTIRTTDDLVLAAVDELCADLGQPGDPTIDEVEDAAPEWLVDPVAVRVRIGALHPPEVPELAVIFDQAAVEVVGRRLVLVYGESRDLASKHVLAALVDARNGDVLVERVFARSSDLRSMADCQ